MVADYKRFSMKENINEQEYVYEQGIANLKLEGMHWTAEQDQMARQYLSGEISKQQLIKEALQYARSQ
tara:strand:+ start:1148 stop:1351 length:204 start_codon:yes stop_codon:yes gene_type:complete